MNAALLLMTSSLMAGQAPAAMPAPAAPAAVAGCGTGCNTGCDSCDPCAKKPGLFDRLKAKMACHKANRCAPAPTCCAPAPAPTCAAACDQCGSPRPNLLDKIRGKMASRKHKGDCCAPACDGCSAAPAAPTAPPAALPGGAPPANMPPKKVSADAPLISIPSPGTVSVPSIPVTPVTGGANSPY